MIRRRAARSGTRAAHADPASDVAVGDRRRGGRVERRRDAVRGAVCLQAGVGERLRRRSSPELRPSPEKRRGRQRTRGPPVWRRCDEWEPRCRETGMPSGRIGGVVAGARTGATGRATWHPRSGAAWRFKSPATPAAPERASAPRLASAGRRGQALGAARPAEASGPFAASARFPRPARATPARTSANPPSETARSGSPSSSTP